jgi:hypothetical protein
LQLTQYSGHFLEQTLRAIGLVYTGAMTKHGKRLDRVLEKALNTPPKPHKTKKKKGGIGHAQKGGIGHAQKGRRGS